MLGASCGHANQVTVRHVLWEPGPTGIIIGVLAGLCVAVRALVYVGIVFVVLADIIRIKTWIRFAIPVAKYREIQGNTRITVSVCHQDHEGDS